MPKTEEYSTLFASKLAHVVINRMPKSHYGLLTSISNITKERDSTAKNWLFNARVPRQPKRLQISDSIGKKEGFSDIGINNKTKMVYATQPKSRKIWIIDGNTRKVDKIKVNDNYYVLTVEPKDNRIFIGGNTRGIIEKPIFSQIDCTNNKLTEITRKATFAKHRPKKLYHSNQYGLLFCLMDESASSDADSSKTYIRQIDLNSNSMKIDSKKKSMYDRMGFNPIKNHIYFSDVDKGEFSVLDHSLKEIGLFKYAEEKKRKYGKIKICVNSKTNNIYISEEGSNLLYVIKD